MNIIIQSIRKDGFEKIVRKVNPETVYGIWISNEDCEEEGIIVDIVC